MRWSWAQFGHKLTPLVNHLIRSAQQRVRNRQAEGLRRLEVDDQFELRWLLDRQIGWLGALQDLVTNTATVRPGTRPEHATMCGAVFGEQLDPTSEIQVLLDRVGQQG